MRTIVKIENGDAISLDGFEMTIMDEAKAYDQAKQQLLEAYCGSDGKPYCTCETPKSSQLEDPSNEGRVYTVEI